MARKDAGSPGTCAVKSEPSEPLVAVKREPVEGKRGFAKSAHEHYRFQVAFVDQVVKPPWKICFSSLGTGFLGVRPENAPPLVAKQRGMAAEEEDGTQPDALDGTQKAAAKEKGVGVTYDIPLDATIIIFVRAPAATLQSRGGRVIGAYREFLDTTNRKLEWSGQRMDINNKRVNAIIRHCRDGGRVVVGVRPPSDNRFRLLGELSSVDDLQKARFLVEAGDNVLREQGTNTFHKCITVSCLNDGLKRGVGLVAARHPTGTKNARWCKSCCYVAPRVVLNFSELFDEGVEAFQSLPVKRKREPGMKVEPGTGVKLEEVKKEIDEGPRKRLRFKQPVIKVEPDDESSSMAQPVGASGVKVKIEPQDEDEPDRPSVGEQLIEAKDWAADNIAENNGESVKYESCEQAEQEEKEEDHKEEKEEEKEEKEDKQVKHEDAGSACGFMEDANGSEYCSANGEAKDETPFIMPCVSAPA
eukprot:TRINITY_DN1116_c0_g1_i1.p1 TRINITY_DN1116_c0_g1~~TRINITY_DN1116_c0_g1_i1.p1  ORF type:complete len:495 (-),score=90.99 TRINITY_DN1116_c0_g1_i1:352-1767(-)